MKTRITTLMMIVAATGIVILTSCAKEAVPESYYVKCKVDGVTYVPTSIVYTNHLAGSYANTIVANDTVNAQYLAFSLRDILAEPIVQQYVLDSSCNAGLGMQTSTGSYVAGQGSSTALGSGNLNFTEVTSTKVKGTFSGVIIASPTLSKTITEGEFNVKRE